MTSACDPGELALPGVFQLKTCNGNRVDVVLVVASVIKASGPHPDTPRSEPMHRSHKLASLLIAFLVASSLPMLADNATGSFERSIKVTGKADVEVYTGSGEITVRGGETSEVHIEARIQTRDGNGNWLDSSGLSGEEKVRRLTSNPPIHQDGNHIVIGRIEDRDLKNNVSISYEITVPSDSRVGARSGSGDERISGISGPLTAETGSGGVHVSRIGGETRIQTGSGAVQAEGVKGSLNISTGSGDVSAEDAAGSCDVHTGSGDITLNKNGSGDVRASAGSGTVRIRHASGGVEAHTGSGDIEVEGDARSEWHVRTGSGDV